MAAITIKTTKWKDFAFTAAIMYGLDVDVQGLTIEDGKPTAHFMVYGERDRIERLAAKTGAVIESDFDLVEVDKLD